MHTVRPHKKIHILTTYIIALTAREAPSLRTLVLWGATDLIAGGDWTVPREGFIGQVFFRTNDVSADKCQRNCGLLFQSPFFHPSSSVLGPHYSGPPGFEKARGRGWENVSVTGDHVKAGGWRERNDPSHGPPDSASSGQEHARFWKWSCPSWPRRVIFAIIAASDAIQMPRQTARDRAVNQWNPLLRFDITGCNKSALKTEQNRYHDRRRAAE